MLHAHNMVYAAMFALHWEAFARWLVDEEKDLEYMCVLSNNVQLLLDALSEEDVEKATSVCADATDQLKKLSYLMAEFDEARTSPTTKLWLMYMDMGMILRRFIHAERAGLCEEHLAEVEKMLPYLVAAGHYKYGSCLPHSFKAKKVYEEESAVVRNLYFFQEDRKVEVFGYEWTSCPASLFEPDPSLDQSYAMRKGNKADYPWQLMGGSGQTTAI